MNRLLRWVFLPLIFVSAVACASSPWAIERKEEIRTEQAKDFDEKTNIERRLQDLEDGAFESQDGETAALRRRVAVLEDEIAAGDAEIVEVETQDSNSQISLWASIVAGVLGIGGLGKATYGKSRSAPVISGLEVQVARGELELERLATEVHKKIDAGEAMLNQRMSQLAGILQAIQIGMNQPPVSDTRRPEQPVVSPNDNSTPTV